MRRRTLERLRSRCVRALVRREVLEVLEEHLRAGERYDTAVALAALAVGRRMEPRVFGGASPATLLLRVLFGGRKGARARRRLGRFGLVP